MRIYHCLPLPLFLSLVLSASLRPASVAVAAEPLSFDVVVYGGTVRRRHRRGAGRKQGKYGRPHRAGQASRRIDSGGLGATDIGNKPDSIGGMSREFYQRVKKTTPTPQTGNTRSRKTIASHKHDPMPT